MAYWSKRPRRQPEVPDVVNRQPMAAAVQSVGPTWHHVASRLRQAWQERAEYFAAELGLVRFANGLTAQASGRCDLRVEKLVDPVTNQWEPIDADIERMPAQVLHEFAGPFAETPHDLLAQLVWHYKCRGDCYLTVDARPEGGLDWAIRATRTIQFRTNDALVMDLPGGSVSDGTARALPKEQVARLWVPDETWPLLATSNMRGVIADCERYLALARRIRREAESALTNGLLFTPEYAHKYPPAEPGQPQSEQPLSRFDRDYYRIAEMTYHDDDSVSAIAPMTVHYGHEQISEDPMPPSFIYPGRTLDPSSIPLREEAAENIARGLDIPTMLALGGAKAQPNHWTSWLYEESFIKQSVAPTLERACWGDLTASMYRPTLRRLAVQGIWNGNPDLYRIGFDTTPITIHPDRGATAITMYGLGLLEALPVLEANGFNEGDLPSAEALTRIVEVLSAIRGRQPESIQVQSSPVTDSPATEGASGLPGPGPQAVGPATVKELPPGSPTMAALSAALSPYECEVDAWLDEPVSA